MKQRNGRTLRRTFLDAALWPLRLALAGLLLLPVLSGCGGAAGGAGSAGPSGTGTPADKGQVLIGLTDADGDFLSYAVDVQSLTLTKADGTTVETLPASTRVDFAQYTSVTEFLTAATVPVGKYTQATLRLDFSTADVQVEVDGAPVAAALMDGDGNSPGVLDVAVELAGDKDLKVVPGLPAHLVLDFDLAASNQVDLTDPEAPVVTVQPFLVASVNPVDPKPHRLRGLLKAVNVNAHLFQIRVLPFLQLRPALPVPDDAALAKAFNGGLSDADHDGFPDQTDGLCDDNHDGVVDHNDGYGFGVFPVKTDADTAFEVDGVTYTGDEGLKALAELPQGAPVVALGDVNPAGRHMRAAQVWAGSSVPWAGKDAVTGTVVARDADTLTVRGAALSFSDGFRAFRDTVTVLVGPDTTVTRLDVDPATLDESAISVGQRIIALGNLLPVLDTTAAQDTGTDSATTTDAPSDIQLPPVLDATSGSVRLLLSSLSGKVVSVGPGTLVVDVRAMNGRAVSAYDFTGTGATGDDDADPANYEIDTGTLGLDFVTEGSAVQVRGFVTPFGGAPPDYTARTVVGTALTVDGAALMDVNWDPATDTPFSEATADGVTVSLDGVGERHHLIQRWHLADLLDLAEAPRIVPGGSGRGHFAVSLPDSLHIYFTFAGFVQAVEDFQADGNSAVRLVAHGDWSADATTLTSEALSLQMAPAVAPG